MNLQQVQATKDRQETGDRVDSVGPLDSVRVLASQRLLTRFIRPLAIRCGLADQIEDLVQDALCRVLERELDAATRFHGRFAPQWQTYLRRVSAEYRARRGATADRREAPARRCLRVRPRPRRDGALSETRRARTAPGARRPEAFLHRLPACTAASPLAPARSLDRALGLVRRAIEPRDRASLGRRPHRGASGQLAASAASAPSRTRGRRPDTRRRAPARSRSRLGSNAWSN